ncbi:hypothetical protein EVAR_101433_1 [Eumeta japonica]|uniref:Uncharacterized protein n=1 Tax=Eumeta variegata TaxID=151549 RepID=A0A4C1TRX8_EUMVA|nr:hypothetical protein EVAR_101433_1 [Eumeta japonica]
MTKKFTTTFKITTITLMRKTMMKMILLKISLPVLLKSTRRAKSQREIGNERREKEKEKQILKKLEEKKEETKLQDIKTKTLKKNHQHNKIIKKDDSIKIEVNCNNNNDKRK